MCESQRFHECCSVCSPFFRTISLPLVLPSQAYLTVTCRQATILRRLSIDKQFFSNTLDPWEGDILAAMVTFKEVEVIMHLQAYSAARKMLHQQTAVNDLSEFLKSLQLICRR